MVAVVLGELLVLLLLLLTFNLSFELFWLVLLLLVFFNLAEFAKLVAAAALLSKSLADDDNVGLSEVL